MLSSNTIRLHVTIRRHSGPDHKQVLGDVRSVIEISDADDEGITRLSFYNHDSPHREGQWHDIKLDEIDVITIRRRSNP